MYGYGEYIYEKTDIKNSLYRSKYLCRKTSRKLDKKNRFLTKMNNVIPYNRQLKISYARGVKPFEKKG